MSETPKVQVIKRAERHLNEMKERLWEIARHACTEGYEAGKEFERARIVKELVEAGHLRGPYLFPIRHPGGDPWYCHRCGHDTNCCICKHNAILKIVNPDAETGT